MLLKIPAPKYLASTAMTGLRLITLNEHTYHAGGNLNTGKIPWKSMPVVKPPEGFEGTPRYLVYMLWLSEKDC